MSAALGRGPGRAAHPPPGHRTAYLTLRDPDVDMSLSVSVPRQRRSTRWPCRWPRAPASCCRPSRPSGPSAAPCSSTPGRSARSASASCSPGSSTSSARSPPRACSTRDRKRPLPFLPRRVGLVCGRASAAEKDVVENARRRWPAVRFEIREVAVQGPDAVTEVVAALRELDARPGGRRHRHRPRRRRARGPAAVQQRGPGPGGRRGPAPPSSAPSATTSTPRCSTSSPTSAPPRRPTPAKLVVPDAGRASAPPSTPPATGCTGARRPPGRARAAGTCAPCVSRPVMADPSAPSSRAPAQELDALRARARRRVQAGCTVPPTRSSTCARRCGALSPLSTLERGYAVVQHATAASSWTRTTSRRTSCCGCAWPAATSACARSADARRPCAASRAAGTGAAPRRAGRDGRCRAPVVGCPRGSRRPPAAPAAARTSPTSPTCLRAGPRRAHRDRRASSRAARSASRTAWRCGERGEALAAHCSTWLDGAEAKLGEPPAASREPTPTRRADDRSSAPVSRPGGRLSRARPVAALREGRPARRTARCR